MNPFQVAIWLVFWTFALTQAQLDDYILRLEEAERKLRAAEAKIAEKDQRITEVERLLACMDKVKPFSSTGQ